MSVVNELRAELSVAKVSLSQALEERDRLREALERIDDGRTSPDQAAHVAHQALLPSADEVRGILSHNEEPDAN